MNEEKWMEYLGELADVLECEDWDYDADDGHYIFWYGDELSERTKRTWMVVGFQRNTDDSIVIRRTRDNDRKLLKLLLYQDIIDIVEYSTETSNDIRVKSETDTKTKQVYGDRDTLILAYIANNFKRRTLESLIKQTGLSKVEIELALKLNIDIWSRVKGCKGIMYEMNNSVWDELINENR